ncbi:MAG: SAM-dependent methyltransferase [Nanoarchaeota archaeon]|nr:SAM-dependent methyltransferase [Nanoarchaeota archaeon]|tara:strand:+ start:1064 stop:1801 length:738 start_codon:yes stop_codon:yes gene_type:complete
MTSFDTIGSIAIFSEEFKGMKKKAEEVLKIRNIETVAVKTKVHSGVFRTRKINILAGKRKKETTHKESGAEVKLNVETCYFSPRLSNERLRISELIKKDENVLVMFSGVGIYPIVFSKNSKAKEIVGVEINPKAHKYALENLGLNKVKNVKLYKGNVNDILPKLRKKFDRIVMPLPKDADEFLDLAVKKIKKNGIIHLYDFEKEEDIPDKILEKIKGLKVVKIVKCGSFGPGKFRVCVDLKVDKV